MKESSNRRLLRRQQDALKERERPGERLARHPITQHAIYVCTACGRPGHRAEECPGGMPTPPAHATDRQAAPEEEVAMPCMGPVLPCWLCGNLPFTLGLDVSAKVCMNLSRDIVRGRMDYSLPGCSLDPGASGDLEDST